MTNIDSAYLIYKDGSTIYAKNGKTGVIDFRGSNAKNIITSALGKLTYERSWKEKITVLGDLFIDNSASPLTIPDYTIFNLFGRMIAKEKTKVLIQLGSNTTIEHGTYDGNRGEEHSTGPDNARVIFADNQSNVAIKDLKVVNGFGKGIQVRYPKNNIIENVIVENCDKNIMHNVLARDLETDQGSCFIKNIFSNDAIEFGLGATSPNLFVDGYFSRNCKLPISIEGFKNLSLENINVDKPFHVSTSDIRPETAGKIGWRVYINKVFAPGLYMRFKTPVESIVLDNVSLVGSESNGLQILASSSNNVKYLRLNNVEVSGARYKGISITKNGSSTGRFKHLFMDNVIVHDCGARGMVLSEIDFLHMTNSLAIGNYPTGIDIANSSRIKIINTDSIVQGLHNQKCPLAISNSGYINVVGCYLENGGESTILTNVTNYNFDNCEGTFPILRKTGTALMPSGHNSITFAHGMLGIPKVTLGAGHAEVADAIVVSDDTNIMISTSRVVTADRKINWFASIKA